MVRCHVTHDGQPEPGAIGPATDHWVENVLAQLRRDSGPVVDDVYPADKPMAPGADGDLPQGAGAKSNGGCFLPVRVGGLAFKGSLHGITGNVEEGLDQLLFVPRKLRQAGIVIAIKNQFAMTFRFQ